MRRGLGWLALAAVLAVAPAWARAPQAAADAAHGSKAVRKDAAAIARQRARVQHLQQDVDAQEAGSRAAAQRLQQQDAQIAELQRQLQAAQQAGAATGKAH